MLAFAGNSLLCRLALKSGSMDAVGFTAIRLLSGALVLALIQRVRSGAFSHSGDWTSALALFVYAAALGLAADAVCRCGLGRVFAARARSG